MRLKMQLKISLKNSKIGNVPNLSLPPGVSCAPDIPCLTEGCYAMKAYRLYPGTRKAWNSNLEFYNEDPSEFFREFLQWLIKHNPKRFRLFVGGDFPDEDFLMHANILAIRAPKTKFLVFTKRYDYDYRNKPENLQVILSTWPGVPLPENTDLPWAWLEGDDRRSKNRPHFVCPGGCTNCEHKCWDFISADIPVVFKKH